MKTTSTETAEPAHSQAGADVEQFSSVFSSVLSLAGRRSAKAETSPKDARVTNPAAGNRTKDEKNYRGSQPAQQAHESAPVTAPTGVPVADGANVTLDASAIVNANAAVMPVAVSGFSIVPPDGLKPISDPQLQAVSLTRDARQLDGNDEREFAGVPPATPAGVDEVHREPPITGSVPAASQQPSNEEIPGIGAIEVDALSTVDRTDGDAADAVTAGEDPSDTAQAKASEADVSTAPLAAVGFGLAELPSGPAAPGTISVTTPTSIPASRNTKERINFADGALAVGTRRADTAVSNAATNKAVHGNIQANGSGQVDPQAAEAAAQVHVGKHDRQASSHDTDSNWSRGALSDDADGVLPFPGARPGRDTQDNPGAPAATTASMVSANMAITATAASTVDAAPQSSGTATPTPDRGIPVGTGHPIPAAGASGVDSARLLQTMSQSEMRVGLHSADFGSIAIRTSIAQQEIVARISLDHGDLAQVIATHAAAAESKLGNEHGLHARIEVHEQSGMLSGDSLGSSQREQQKAPTRSIWHRPNMNGPGSDSGPGLPGVPGDLGYHQPYQLDVQA